MSHRRHQPMLVVSRLVEQDGPRAIHRVPLGGYIVSCYDCRWTAQHRHRIDAEDAYDAHTCYQHEGSHP